MRLKKCKECGKEFESTTLEQYKCPACVDKFRRENVRKVPKVCQICGISFEGFPGSKYCSICSNEAKRERERKYKKSGASRKLGDIDKCLACGNDYVVESGMQKYCKACSEKMLAQKTRDRKRAYNAEHYPERAVKRVENHSGAKVCVICGERIYASTPTVTCSPECEKELIYQKGLTHVRKYGMKTKAPGEMGKILRLKEHRERAGMSLSALSKATGINVTMLSRYERGLKQLHEVKFLDALAIAKVLNISPYDLLPEE